jgi:3-deoxy-D-manno-octulosonate 8-phosphate phosphatase (KDO 8-P phosphatase)
MTFSAPKDIQLIVMDVDGVLTAGEAVYSDMGTMIYLFNTQDGAGLKYWRRNGGRSAIITGRESQAVMIRAELLDIEFVYQKSLKKIDAYRELLGETKISPAQVCYVGDDLPDLPVMVNCGFPVAVANAVPEVKAAAAYVTQRSGGDGAVREVIEVLLNARGLWEPLVQSYLTQTL